jgi:2',3'-cyclic-nucleotide 2'-phosphodiesterase/3'-nucleotidase
MMLVMNYLRYDSMTVGNHEFNFGTTVWKKARSEALFPWLSGNIFNTADSKQEFQPYLIKQINGIKIGIIGITTAGIPNWEDSNNILSLEFQNPRDKTAAYVKQLREEFKVDLIVVAMHMGLEDNLATGQVNPGQVPMENAALAIARSVPGVDLILMGHTHRQIPALVVNGVLMSQAGSWASGLGRADVYFEKQADGKWVITGKSSQYIPVNSSTPMDPVVEKMLLPFEERTQAWLSRPIAHNSTMLTAVDSRSSDSAIIDLIHRVQLDVTGADISFASSFTLEAKIPSGVVSVRDIYSLYVYENVLFVIEATGEQIKQALEHSARYYVPYVKGASLSSLIDPRIPGYNFDSAEGVSYEIDITKPQGMRIQNLRYKGETLDANRKLKVALNNYRYNGGGGYTMFKKSPVLHRSSSEIRNLLIEWLETHKEVPVSPSNNWRIISE